MPRRAYPLLALSVGLMAATVTGPLRAQSGDETVAFMLFGERSSQLYVGSALRPLTSAGKENGADVTTTEELVRRSSCEYSLKRDHHLKYPAGGEGREREVLDFDFSKLVDADIKDITGAAFRGGKGLTCLSRFSGEGLSPVGERECMDEWVFSIEPGSAPRWRRAVAHFRSAFCQGRAF